MVLALLSILVFHMFIFVNLKHFHTIGTNNDVCNSFEIPLPTNSQSWIRSNSQS